MRAKTENQLNNNKWLKDNPDHRPQTFEHTLHVLIGVAVNEAINPLSKKINKLIEVDNKRMLNKTEAAEFLGISIPTFNKFSKESGFPKDAAGFWAKGWLENWTNNR
jgi:predicted DNA-binding transcriptional regulator AlpA